MRTGTPGTGVGARVPGIARRLTVVSLMTGGLAATMIGGPAAAAPTTTPSAEPIEVAAVDFAGTVALSNCSGALVSMPNSGPEDPAFVMSNGHCLESGMPGPGEVVVEAPSSRSFQLLDADASTVGTLRAEAIAYATMTDTDVSLYRLTQSYAEIEAAYGIAALPVAADHPVAGTAISVVSGYWERVYSCDIDDFVYELHESSWVWTDSIRYTPECQTIGGTSGSPVLNTDTGEVVGVNNTGNTSGGRCTMNEPCEVDENGTVTVREGINYGQQTYQITACVAEGNVIDLTLPGCTLPQP
ncbi:Serine protease [Stackebrandtia soli]